MLGEIITRVLMLVLGYAYPAFECFKTVEKNKVEIEELRFWCQYWILVAMVTVLEKIGDIFVSWLPMYVEMKLALFIYLWYPKTKGTGFVYESLLRPYMSKHETDIDRNLQEFRVRAWDLLIYYWQNCTELGQTTFLQMVHYLASQVGKLRQPSLEPEGQKAEKQETISAHPKSPPLGGIFRRHKQQSDRRRPPIPPPSPYSTHRSVTPAPKSELVQVLLHDQTQLVRTEEVDLDDGSKPKDNSDLHLNHNLNTARLKLRRTQGSH